VDAPDEQPCLICHPDWRTVVVAHVCSDECFWVAVHEKTANTRLLASRDDGQLRLTGEDRRRIDVRQGLLWSAILQRLQRRP
jgi:hypothetical protein